MTLAVAADAAVLRPEARPVAADVVEDAVLRPVARTVADPLRPVARTIVTETLSTMSAPAAAFYRDRSLDDGGLLGGVVQEAVARAFRPVIAAPAVVTGLRPVLRPYREPAPVVVVDPTSDAVILPAVAGLSAAQFSEQAVAVAMIPPERPEGITEAAMALQAERERGSVCGDLAIQGVTLGSVPGPGACGFGDAVEVRSVAGVTLSTPARIDCTTAVQLRRWVQQAAIPQFRDVGGGLARIDIMGAYSCRTRNNVPGARLSEHAFGRALDIGGFRMQDGTRVTVLQGWNSSYGQRLRALHQAACGPFGTVLGPNANAAHRDHFHFDTARYRSGSYCR